MITIVTCIYNQLDTLFRECIASVDQVTDDFEWIIIDDASDIQFYKRYETALSNIRSKARVDLVRLDRNSGLSIARNAALTRARGDWIVVLDSDDKIAADIGKNLSRLTDSASLACFRTEYLTAAGGIEIRPMRRWKRLFEQYGGTVLDPFLWFDFYYHGIIARRGVLEQIGGYDPSLRYGEDQDILLRAVESIARHQTAFIDHVGYRYRENTRGVCKTHWEEVEVNYCRTMLDAVFRRGGDFKECRFAGAIEMDGAMVDEYQYCSAGRWISWGELSGGNIVGA